jgi:DNA replicative helicase MCM subunit Mcm2 (Cdc46/Mcm family)
MEIDSNRIQRKVKIFLKYNFHQEFFYFYKNEPVKVFKIFLEDILSYDNELYFLLLKKPEKVIFIFEFSIKKLIEKVNCRFKKTSEKKNFQLILLRKFFKTIPKKWFNILEGEFVSLKVIILSISNLKLKTEQKIISLNKDGIWNNLKSSSRSHVNYPDKPITSDFLFKKTLDFFVDYQTAKAIGFLDLGIENLENIDIVLILEGIFTKTFSPGDEIFVSGVSVLSGLNTQYGKKNIIIKVLGFAKLNFANKFRISNSFENLDKKFIKFAHSKNIYKWIYSIIIPEIQESLDFKRAFSCLLFGGNEKILANNFFSSGKINILVFGNEIGLFQKINNYLKILNLEKKENDKKTTLKNLSSSELYKFCENFGVLLIENFENLSFEEQIILGNCFDYKFHHYQKELLENENNNLTIFAFTDIKNKIFHSQKILTPGPIIFMENLKKFDLLISSSVIDQKNFIKKNLEIKTKTDSKKNKFNNNSSEFLKYYILFVKKKFIPKLSKKAAEMIKNAYLFLKISKKKSFTFDFPETNRIRELETMIKISEAFAKMRMVNHVDLSDALEAIRITQKLKI